MSDYIVFGQPDIQDAEIAEVVATMESKWLGTGPKVKEFETLFSAHKKIDSDKVVALNSCTAALHLALVAAGVGPGDEVITTGMTFCATVNAIIHTGATPVIVDVDPDSFNIDVNKIFRALTKRTKAIVPVHFSGVPCDMGVILSIADKHGLKVIEDCAHAVEGQWEGLPLGTIGDFGCFSFYATKNVTTGEGGMVVAKKSEDICRIKTLSLHGMSADAWGRFSDNGYKHYQVVEPGYKYNMMDLQAAIGIHQLERVHINLEKRQKVYSRYQDALIGLPLRLPAYNTLESDVCSFHLYPILLDEGLSIDRDTLMCRLHEMGVGTGVHYLSVLSHPYYKRKYSERCKTPIADDIGRRTLSLPMSPTLTELQQAKVIASIKEILKNT